MGKIVKSIKRPGGFEITNRAISFCKFDKGAKILDLGCGEGATVDFLTDKGFEAAGIDRNPANINLQKNLLVGLAETMPFQNSSMDGIIMECSFNLMDDQKTVLKRCFEVLKPAGKLIISVLYARGKTNLINGSCIGLVETKEDIIQKLEGSNFCVELFEDYSTELRTMWGQMIFDQGAKAFYCDLGVCPEKLKEVKCGYCLIVAKKCS